MLQPDYASPMTSDTPLAPACTWWLVSTFLSPACIAVSFFYLVNDGKNLSGPLASATFLATLLTSGIAGYRFRAGGLRNAVTPLDYVAGVGLLLLAIISLTRLLPLNDPPTQTVGIITAIAFGLLGVSTPRFLFFYNGLADAARARGRYGLARFAQIIGVFKLVNELLLHVCIVIMFVLAVFESEDSAILFGLGALLGVAVYGAIWIATLVLHLRFASLARRPINAGVHGFEVQPIMPAEPVLPVEPAAILTQSSDPA